MKRLIGCTAVLCLLALTVGCGGVTSSGTLAYISNSNGTGFTVYTVNTNGTLTTSSISPQPTPTPTGDGPKVIQFSPNGKWAYFLDSTGDNIYAYTRAGNGTLNTLIDKYSTQGSASALVVAPNSTFLYVAEPNAAVQGGAPTGKLALYSIDQSTGILSGRLAEIVNYAVTQLVMSSSGTLLFGLSPSQQTVVSWTLNASSGLTTQAATLSVGTDPIYMVLSANGSYMYVLDFTGTAVIANVANCGTPPVANCTSLPGPSPNIYGFNVGSNGVLSPMAGTGTAPGVFNENADLQTGVFPTNPIGGVTSHDSRFLFIANQGSQNISVFRIATTSGEPTEVLGSLTSINGITTSTASPFPCGAGCSAPSFVTVAKTNNALYVLDEAAGKIFQLAVDQNRGILRALVPAFVTAESATSDPSWITIR